MPREHGRGPERSRGDQNIAARAMNESGGNLARRAGLPQGITRQLRRLPKKVADRRNADIERDPNQAGGRRITN
jgi:hypothetical protein